MCSLCRFCHRCRLVFLGVMLLMAGILSATAQPGRQRDSAARGRFIPARCGVAAANSRYFLCLCRSNHCLAASSMTSEAVRSTSSAACLMARMTSGSMVVRNCRLSPGGGIRPLLGDGLSSAIALPLRGAIVGISHGLLSAARHRIKSLIRVPDKLARIHL